jgi:hypothetical protein
MREHLNALEILRTAFVEYLKKIEIDKKDFLEGTIEFVFWRDEAHSLLLKSNIDDEFLGLLSSEIDVPSQRLASHQALREYLFRQVIDVHSKKGLDAIKFVYVIAGSSDSNERVDTYAV